MDIESCSLCLASWPCAFCDTRSERQATLSLRCGYLKTPLWDWLPLTAFFFGKDFIFLVIFYLLGLHYIYSFPLIASHTTLLGAGVLWRLQPCHTFSGLPRLSVIILIEDFMIPELFLHTCKTSITHMTAKLLPAWVVVIIPEPKYWDFQMPRCLDLGNIS